MEAVAKLRNVPTSPRKMRLVANLVRGKNVQQALGLLKFEPSQGAARVEQLLLSAIANWGIKNEGERIEDANLYVKTIHVDGGRMIKRLRPAPQGRGHRIRKRSNHITMVIDSRPLTDPTQDAVRSAALEQKIANRRSKKQAKNAA